MGRVRPALGRDRPQVGQRWLHSARVSSKSPDMRPNSEQMCSTSVDSGSDFAEARSKFGRNLPGAAVEVGPKLAESGTRVAQRRPKQDRARSESAHARSILCQSWPSPAAPHGGTRLFEGSRGHRAIHIATVCIEGIAGTAMGRPPPATRGGRIRVRGAVASGGSRPRALDEARGGLHHARVLRKRRPATELARGRLFMTS